MKTDLFLGHWSTLEPLDLILVIDDRERDDVVLRVERELKNRVPLITRVTETDVR